MSRPLVTLLLVVAAVGTGYLAVTLLGGSGGDGRRERDAQSYEEDRPERGDRPPPERTKTPRKTPPADAGRTWTVSGTVSDQARRPISGAMVRAKVFGQALTRGARTDENGRYRLEMPAPAFAFDVSASGYLPLVGVVNGRTNRTQDYVCEGTGPWEKSFVLRVGASVSGRVLDEARGAVGGARVYAISAEHSLLDQVHAGNVAVSDRDGFYRFPGLAKGTYDIGVRAEAYLPALVRDVAVPERGQVNRDLTVRRGRKVKVRVFEATVDTNVLAADSRLRGVLLPPGGVRALANALVGRELVDRPVVAGRADQVEDDSLVFTLTGVAAGPADVAAEDVRRITEPGLGSLLDTTEAELELRLLHPGLLTGEVFDAVTRERLEPAVARETEGVAQRFPLEWTGNMLMVPKDDRRHTLHFTLDGYQPAQHAVPDRLPNTFEVLMQPLAEGETGAFFVVFEPKLPAGARVALVGRDADGRQLWVRHLERADAQGRWAVTSIPAGEYVVSVLASGMVPATLPRVVVTRSLKETHRIRLEKGGGLSFKVADPEGKLLDKVHLLLKDAAGTQIDMHILTHVSEGRAFLSVNYVPSAATARADSGLAQGLYTLTVYKSGYEPATEEFAIRGTEVAEVSITLTPR